MIAFRDRKGRAWTRRLDVDAAVRIRGLAGLDVMALAADEAAAARYAGPSPEVSAEIADALFALFLPDAVAAGIDDRAFGRRLRVRADELRTLLFEGVAEFFAMPGPPPTGPGGREATAEELWQDVYRLAGEAGIDPGPRTYGELAVLADGRRRAEWGRTAALRADVINSNPYRKGQAVRPADLDPTGGLKEAGTGGGIELTPDDAGIELLARAFLRN